MRRSLSYCDPNTCYAGDTGAWTFNYAPATALAKGARLRFDLNSFGREIDWEIPQVNSDKGNAIFALLPNGQRISPKGVKGSQTGQFDFTLTAEVKAAQVIKICLGRPGKADAGKKTADSAQKGGTNRAQISTQRRRPFYLQLDPKGSGHFEEPESFNMDVRGNFLKTIKILTPSFVCRNKRFNVTVRFEDAHGNLTSLTKEPTLLELSYHQLRENLKWQLFVSETGFVTLPNLYFNEPGIYRISLKNLSNGEIFLSSPIKCFAEETSPLYWGLLHGESDRVDSAENIEACLRYFRDDHAMNFYATSNPENAEETKDELWRRIGQMVAEFNEEERFSTMLGFLWKGEQKKEGLRHLIYTKDQKPLLRAKDAKSNNLKKLYKVLGPKDLIAIPCFTMGKSTPFDFTEFAPEVERVVEIYCAWGSSECLQSEGNPFPIKKSKGKEEVCKEGSLRAALNKGHRFGFVAGGLDDRGPFESFFSSDQQQYSPGLTAIIAKSHTREALLESLWNRSCYATTGKRILLGFYLAGQPMGRELSTAQKPGLAVNRHLHGFVAGTELIAQIEIIRNGKVLHTFDQPETDDQDQCEFSFDDSDALEKIALIDQFKEPKTPFIYYYVRVRQVDGQTAWSSPIWIDIAEKGLTTAPTSAKKSKKGGVAASP